MRSRRYSKRSGSRSVSGTRSTAPSTAGTTSRSRCDDTPIGAFLEIEGTPDRIAEVAVRLELDMNQALNLSYPKLYELYRSENTASPEFMVFPKDGVPHS